MPEVHTVNVEPHETTFTRDPDVSCSMIVSRGKVLELVSHIMEINGTLLKCMVGMGAEVNILHSALAHNLDICPSTMIIKAWYLYALQTVGEAVCFVLYKGIALTAKFYVVKGMAVNIVPFLSCDLCLQLDIMHELSQNTSGVVMSDRIEGDTQDIVQRHCGLFNSGVLSIGCVRSAVGFKRQALCTVYMLCTSCTCGKDPSGVAVHESSWYYLGGGSAYGLELTHDEHIQEE
ncbi:unnamed protein product [Caretta caretta]